MKESLQMVKQVSKLLNVTERTVVGCALIYNSARWRLVVGAWELTHGYDQYLDGHMSTELENFCLDILSNRLHLNMLTTALHKLNKRQRC